jgi:hypothetical protein
MKSKLWSPLGLMSVSSAERGRFEDVHKFVIYHHPPECILEYARDVETHEVVVISGSFGRVTLMAIRSFTTAFDVCMVYAGTRFWMVFIVAIRYSEIQNFDEAVTDRHCTRLRSS